MYSWKEKYFKMKNRNPNRSSVWSAGLVTALVATALLIFSLITFYVLVPMLIKYMVLQETRLVNGTETWEKWTKIQAPIFIKFYIFNVTNVAEAENGGKFKVKEVGPYVWEEARTKDVIAIDEDEDTITYKEIIHYYFRRDLSVGSQEDTVNLVNLPFIGAATMSYKLLYSSLANYVMDYLMGLNETMVMRNVNLRELLFDGVDVSEKYGILTDFEIAEMPEEFIDGTFALYNKRNGTPSKAFKVFSGIKNYEDFGKIVEYDHKPELNFWTNHSLPPNAEQYCNKLNGTDGTIFAPFVSKDQSIPFFSPEVCRSVNLDFNRELNFEGVPAYEFKLTEKIFAADSFSGDYQCFCMDPGDGLASSCDKSGVSRMFSCKKGAPVAISYPHFVKASNYFSEAVDGMEPNEGKHNGSIIVEPISGLILKATKRLQVSIELQPLPGIASFSNVTPAFIPIFWAEETGELDENTLQEIKDRLVTPLETLKILKPTVLSFLAIAIMIGTLIHIFRKTSSKLLLAGEVAD